MISAGKKQKEEAEPIRQAIRQSYIGGRVEAIKLDNGKPTFQKQVIQDRAEKMIIEAFEDLIVFRYHFLSREEKQDCYFCKGRANCVLQSFKVKKIRHSYNDGRHGKDEKVKTLLRELMLCDRCKGGLKYGEG